MTCTYILGTTWHDEDTAQVTGLVYPNNPLSLSRRKDDTQMPQHPLVMMYPCSAKGNDKEIAKVLIYLQQEAIFTPATWVVTDAQ
jgi:hypothetical protein